MATTALIKAARRPGWKAQPGAGADKSAGELAGGIRTTSASRVRRSRGTGGPVANGPENKRQELRQESERPDLPDRSEFVRAKLARALDKE